MSAQALQPHRLQETGRIRAFPAFPGLSALRGGSRLHRLPLLCRRESPLPRRRHHAHFSRAVGIWDAVIPRLRFSQCRRFRRSCHTAPPDRRLCYRHIPASGCNPLRGRHPANPSDNPARRTGSTDMSGAARNIFNRFVLRNDVVLFQRLRQRQA